MSVFDFLKLDKFKYGIRVDTQHCNRYIAKEDTPDKKVVFTVHLPYKCLRSWHEARQQALAQNIACTYVEILDAILSEETGLKLREGNERIEGRLRRECGQIIRKSSEKRGSSHRKFFEKELKLAVQLDDLASMAELEKKLASETLKNKDLEKRCEDLVKELFKAQHAERMACENYAKAEEEIANLKKQNQALHDYLEGLGQSVGFSNNGKKITETGDRQQRRKLKELKSYVEKALWFAKTFGLDLQNVTLQDENGVTHTLSYNGNEKRGYKDLPEEEQQKVRNILFILDKFCIGEAAYHELTMVSPDSDLPRSYLIKQCKEDLKSICHITRTPGSAQGAQIDFMKELQSVVQKKIEQNTIDIDDPSLTLKIKLSGDGAKMTRLTNFVVISFAVLDSEADMLSSKGNHTIAIIKGQESYELLQQSCSCLLKQVNKLLSTKKLTFNGKDIPVEIYLGGDYKFLLLMLGMKSATSDYACIWCKIFKLDRYDMSKPIDYYWQIKFARTIEDMRNHAQKCEFSCEHRPLLNIALENVVLDELHLMLRITDKLTENLVRDAIEWDRKDNLNKRPMERTAQHVDDLVGAITSCGVTFNIWEKVDADGRGSGISDFTSLMGSDKKILLKKLPDKLGTVTRPEISETVVKIWKEFAELYDLLRIDNPSSSDVTEYFQKAASWVRLFLTLSGKAMGYEPGRVTPYMHAMVYHVPRFMEKCKGVRKFTGQGVEKLNDVCRRVHLHRSNKWDAAKDVLLVGKRMEHLAECERGVRKYNKQNQDYWEEGIKESRAKRHRVCMQPAEVGHLDFDMLNNLTVDEMKLKLRNLGIKTRYRCKKKLKELLINTLEDKENTVV